MLHHHSIHCVHSGESAPESTTRTSKVKLLRTALVLVSCFSLVELVVSHWSQSLALLADAGHMISDSLALGLSLLVAWIAQSPKGGKASDRRLEAISALVNGVGLVAIALWIAGEAALRWQSPPTEILSLPMLITSGVGLGVNSINAVLLHNGSHHDLNLRGAFLHVLADAISSMGVMLAAIAVWLKHWLWVDGVVSLCVSGIICFSAMPLIVQSLNILLTSPQGKVDLDLEQTKDRI